MSALFILFGCLLFLIYFPTILVIGLAIAIWALRWSFWLSILAMIACLMQGQLGPAIGFLILAVFCQGVKLVSTY